MSEKLRDIEARLRRIASVYEDQDLIEMCDELLVLAAIPASGAAEPPVHRNPVCFTCEGESGLPPTKTVDICEQCYGDDEEGDLWPVVAGQAELPMRWRKLANERNAVGEFVLQECVRVTVRELADELEKWLAASGAALTKYQEEQQLPSLAKGLSKIPTASGAREREAAKAEVVEKIRDITGELRRFLSDMRRDAADSHDSQITLYADTVEQFVEDIDVQLKK